MTNKLVKVCPECDRSKINERKTQPRERRWKCYDCGDVFPFPETRPSEHSGGSNPRNGLAQKLCKMDPDELGDNPRPAD